MYLFCLPYAGGSASSYMIYAKFIDERVRIIPVELAGRGARFQEPFYESLDDAVIDVFDFIQNYIKNNESYVIWGHSMGAIIAYKVLQYIYHNHYKSPVMAIYSGRTPPHIPYVPLPVDILNDQELIDTIAEFGGLSDEIRNNAEFKSVFLPVIRADFRMLSSLANEKNIYFKYDFPITVLHGTRDKKINVADIKSWRNYTDSSFVYREFDGDHFFVFQKIHEIAHLLNKLLVNNTKTLDVPNISINLK